MKRLDYNANHAGPCQSLWIEQTLLAKITHINFCPNMSCLKVSFPNNLPKSLQGTWIAFLYEKVGIDYEGKVVDHQIFLAKRFSEYFLDTI